MDSYFHIGIDNLKMIFRKRIISVMINDDNAFDSIAQTFYSKNICSYLVMRIAIVITLMICRCLNTDTIDIHFSLNIDKFHAKLGLFSKITLPLSAYLCK